MAINQNQQAIDLRLEEERIVELVARRFEKHIDRVVDLWIERLVKAALEEIIKTAKDEAVKQIAAKLLRCALEER